MKNDIEYVRYDEALTDYEILSYAQLIDQFKKGEIDFQTLKKLFLDNGVTVEPIPNDFSEGMMPISKLDAIKERISEGKYLYNDIDCFVLSSDEFKNVVFRMDYKAIELLANSGVPEYQETLISILTFQLNNSYDKDEKLALKRAKWERRIAELKSLLEKSKLK